MNKRSCYAIYCGRLACQRVLLAGILLCATLPPQSVRLIVPFRIFSLRRFAPPATRRPPQPPPRWKVRAPATRIPTRLRYNLPPPRRQVIQLGYAWLVTGRQTSSSSSRRRNATSASRPRVIVPPVVSPQWAQQAPTASQSARLLSSPQDLH